MEHKHGRPLVIPRCASNTRISPHHMTSRSRLCIQTVYRSLYVTSCPLIYEHPACIAIQHTPSRSLTRARTPTHTNSTTTLLHPALTKALCHQVLYTQSMPLNRVIVYTTSLQFPAPRHPKPFTPTIPISSLPSADATNTGLETPSDLTHSTRKTIPPVESTT
jgi:hypothetical protein